MTYTIKVDRGLWMVAVTTTGRPYPIYDAARQALDSLAGTEGLSPGFYADDADYMAAVVATFESTELWKRWAGDGPMELVIPYYDATLTVDVTDYGY